ncbi:MAG: DUF1624 domain-containing protein [Gammaproteobacteria bacterium]|nr:DUF1624 domain-containing protein [Gammaproteobacteria bacterium]
MPRKGSRFEGVDLMRGLAIVMMVAYHFCYDLAYFGFASWRPDDMLADWHWIAWRNLIVASFLVLVGVSRALNAAFKPSAPDFWRRWVQIGGGAILVSVASYGFAGQRWIYFGILHFVAVALLLCRLVLWRTRSAPWIAAAGGVALIAGLVFSTPSMDSPPLDIFGFAAHKPPTEDYVPLFPWIGVVLIGLAGGLNWGSRGFEPVAALGRWRAAIPRPVQRALAGLGRWSLSVYLVHQPVLMGLCAAVASVVRPHSHPLPGM